MLYIVQAVAVPVVQLLINDLTGTGQPRHFNSALKLLAIAKAHKKSDVN